MTTGPDDLPPALRRLLGEGQARVERIREFAEDHARRHEFDEQLDTAVKRLEGAAKEIVDTAREKLQSQPVIVVPQLPDRHSEAPSATRVDVHFPGGHIRARGMRAVLAVLAVGLLLALAWMAGSRRPATPPAPAVAPAHS